MLVKKYSINIQITSFLFK